jgi:hypothetical protein
MRPGRAWATAALVLAVTGTPACVVSKQMLAAPDDLADYRAFRTAKTEGKRLAAAQRYLAKHAHGAWGEEVRATFDAEEEAWFEAAKASRSRARDYVIDLPEGPHADGARALLVLFDEHQADLDTLMLLADARRTEATLDLETSRRRHATEVLLAEVGALADPTTWGASLDAAPPALATALRGDVPTTWGGATRARRDDTFFFVLPTPQGSQARVLTWAFDLVLDRGRVVQGLVQGEDLFVLWSEALLVRVLDPTSAADRALAASTVLDVLSGAFEAAVPAARCTGRPSGPAELMARACDGWVVSVRMGREQGEADVVDVVGPRVRTADRAPPAGMR